MRLSLLSQHRDGQRFALWLGILDHFVPLGVRTDRAQRTRAYIVTGIILSNLCMSVLSALVLWLGTDLAPKPLAAGLAITAECIVLYLLALAVFRWQHSYVLAGNIAAAAVFIAVLSGVLLTGGYTDSPIMPLWIVVPVFVFPLSGLMSGIVWSTLIFLAMLGLLVASQMGFTAWQWADPATLSMMSHVLPITLCFMVVVALVIYERVNAQLNGWLQEERQRFAFKASHDSLTDLPNREEFFLRLRGAIREAAQKRQQAALVYIDLDGFKPVNDALGHYAGDKVLKITSQRLREVIRHTDVAARMGGDEFALILQGVQKRSDIELVMTKMLHTLAIPIDVDGREVRVHASAGVAIYPQDGNDPDRLCRLADAAMYGAKLEKNTYRYNTEYREVESV